MRRSVLVSIVLLCFVGAFGAVGCSGSTQTTLDDPEGPIDQTTTTKYVVPGAWTELSPTGDVPAPRLGHAMAYDQASKKLILFGGWNGDSDYDDTWAYDPATNTWTDLGPEGEVPAARHDHTLAYDPESKKLILFGGTSVESTFVGLGDIWAYDPGTNTWEKLSPWGAKPPGRSVHCFAYDPGEKKMILFGGSARGTYLGDTWAYDPATNTWEELSPTGDVPRAQCAGSLVYDAGRKRLVLFGGWDGTYLADTWIYVPAGNTWARLGPAGEVPPGRHSFGMVYDSKVGRTILFGGWQGGRRNAALRDTWSFDSRDGMWTQLDPPGDMPRRRYGFTLVYDPDQELVVLFGGSDDTILFNDTWSYNATRP